VLSAAVARTVAACIDVRFADGNACVERAEGAFHRRLS
jgi:hypothetical protein